MLYHLPYEYQTVRSLSRHGDCYDNVQAAGLWSRLRTEVLVGPAFADLTDAQCSGADHFVCYNYERAHSSVNYQTPHYAQQ